MKVLHWQILIIASIIVLQSSCTCFLITTTTATTGSSTRTTTRSFSQTSFWYRNKYNEIPKIWISTTRIQRRIDKSITSTSIHTNEKTAISNPTSNIHTNINTNRTNDSFVLAKTKESFKLFDLYLLETKLQSQVRNWTQPQLIGMDVNTGSYLLKLDKSIASFFHINANANANTTTYHDERDTSTKPSFINRFEWITNHILAIGTSGEDLINNILMIAHTQTQTQTQHLWKGSFTIDYTCMGVLKNPSQKDYTSSKHLICRVAQCLLPSPAALNHKMAQTRLLLVETPDCIYLAQLEPSKIQPNLEENHVYKKWSNRPYQYSSAINPTIAKVVIDILYDVTAASTSTSTSTSTLCTDHCNKRNHQTTMLDATCGSGTFLAFALEKGINVVGCDINEKCVKGSLQNIDYLFHQDIVTNKCIIKMVDFATSGSLYYHDDSIVVDDSSTTSTSSTEGYDCAVTNLPWGQNTEIKNENDHLKILHQIYKELRQDAHCAIISKTDISNDLTSLGFVILGKSSVPPASFVLPTSRKGKKTPLKKKLDHTCDCMISIVKKIHNI